MFEGILPNEIETLIYQKLHNMYMCDLCREIKNCLVRYNYDGYTRFYVFGGVVKPSAPKETESNCLVS